MSSREMDVTCAMSIPRGKVHDMAEAADPVRSLTRGVSRCQHFNSPDTTPCPCQAKPRTRRHISSVTASLKVHGTDEVVTLFIVLDGATEPRSSWRAPYTAD
ncbi:hypothetical protein MRB53_036898 [Persea americana]|nr:hypothetical protein MRB53_036898 [Persea americana]